MCPSGVCGTHRRQLLSPLTVVIGKNGVGKSTLFDAFGFLADCLKLGVEEACDARGRGGFHKIRSTGQHAPISFEIYYREDGNARPITYELEIDEDKSERPYIAKERLRQRRKNQRTGWPFSFLLLNDGKGIVWSGNQGGQQIVEDKDGFDLSELMESIGHEETKEIERVELEDKRKLGIATFGSLKQPQAFGFSGFGVSASCNGSQRGFSGFHHYLSAIPGRFTGAG